MTETLFALTNDDAGGSAPELFEELLKDEEGHIDFLETQLQLLNSIGVEKYGQLNAKSAEQAE